MNRNFNKNAVKLSKESMKKIKGGYAPVEPTVGCSLDLSISCTCCYNGKTGGFCSSDNTLIGLWAQAWTTAGYQVSCRLIVWA
jgi:hypothetical protein